MEKYEFGSTGIRIKGNDSFHVVKIQDKDEWLLLRGREGTYFQAASFTSPDEARTFVHSCDLTLDKLD